MMRNNRPQIKKNRKKSLSKKNDAPQKRNKKKKQNPKKASKPFRKRKKVLIKLVITSMLLSFVLIGAIFIIVRFRMVEVKDDGMIPDLKKGEKVIIDQQGEICRFNVVLAAIKSESFSGEVLRRVVGLPGDSIWVDGEKVFVNYSLSEAVSLAPQLYANQVPSGTFIFEVKNQEILKEFIGVTNIPSNRYLLINDDFSNTSDSRSFGFINQKRVKGVLAI